MIATSGRSRHSVVLVTLVVLAVVFTPLLHSGARAQSNVLVGRYATAVTKGDLPVEIPNNSNLLGRWVIEFGADGSYAALRLDAGVLVSGTYAVDGDEVTITDESGVLSCTGPIASYGADGDASVGVYTWSSDNGALTLTPVDEPCMFREIILTTSNLAVYVPCGATGEETPVDDEPTSEATASPTEKGGLLDLLTPEAKPTEATDGGSQSSDADVQKVTGEIDNLLGQLTACWNMGDIDKFLLLLTSGSRESFLQLFAGNSGETDPDVLREQAGAAMRSVPSTWERSGDVELTGANKARAIVRWVLAGDEQFLPSRFEFEDGAWRWDAAF